MIESSPIGETLSFQQGIHFKLQSLLEGQKNITFSEAVKALKKSHPLEIVLFLAHCSLGRRHLHWWFPLKRAEATEPLV
jgi:hypothetical protein